MTKRKVAINLRIKLFLLLLCIGLGVSCQTDEAALQNDVKAKAEINRINQILTKNEKISQEDVDSIKKIYADYPTSETARKTLQASLIKREDWASLEKFFNETPFSDLSEEDQLSLAKVYIKLGRYQDSIETLKSLKDQNNAEVRSLLASANFYLGNYDEAKDLLENSWEQIIKEKRIEDIYLRGMLYFYAKENEKAIDTFNQVLEIDSNHIPANNALSRVFAAQGNTEKAEEYLAKVQKGFDKITADEKATKIMVQQAYEVQEAYKAKRYAEVISLANAVIPKVDDKNKLILYQYLYNSYQALGRTQEAQETLAKAKQLQQK